MRLNGSDRFWLLKVGFVWLNCIKSPVHELSGRMLTTYLTKMLDSKVPHYAQDLKADLARLIHFS